MDRVTTYCFVASYTLALAFELLHQLRPRPIFRLVALANGAAGLAAHTLFLIAQQPPLAGQFGWLLYLGWVLAIFYLAGSLHHRRQAWGVFVLPLVLGLVGLGLAIDRSTHEPQRPIEEIWGPLHGWLLLLSAVGVCIGFLASLMYLLQARRLRAKLPPGKGLRLLSLERLEEMHRRAIGLAFPLLTAGLIVGVLLMVHGRLDGWTDPRVLGTAVLWPAFVVLLYLRYSQHARGRKVAVWTIVTFALLVGCLVLAHNPGQGGGR